LLHLPSLAVEGERCDRRVADAALAGEGQNLRLRQSAQHVHRDADHHVVGDDQRRLVGADDLGEHRAEAQGDVGPGLPAGWSVPELADAQSSRGLIRISRLHPVRAQKIENPQLAVAQSLVHAQLGADPGAVACDLGGVVRPSIRGAPDGEPLILVGEPGAQGLGLFDTGIGERSVGVARVERQHLLPGRFGAGGRDVAGALAVSCEPDLSHDSGLRGERHHHQPIVRPPSSR
jgi:hypothetical protein